MKSTCALVLFCCIILHAGLVYSAEEDQAGQTYISEYQGKKYTATLPSAVLKASPDFDYSSTTLPKALKDIVEIAKVQLNKITKADQTWELQSITFNPSYSDKKKWFYAIGFQSNSNQYFTVLVTIDGHLGVLKEIQEKIIE